LKLKINVRDHLCNLAYPFSYKSECTHVILAIVSIFFYTLYNNEGKSLF
jgi:hypothetical protein